jgi:hypothetical protein
VGKPVAQAIVSDSEAHTSMSRTAGAAAFWYCSAVRLLMDSVTASCESLQNQIISPFMVAP